MHNAASGSCEVVWWFVWLRCRWVAVWWETPQQWRHCRALHCTHCPHWVRVVWCAQHATESGYVHSTRTCSTYAEAQLSVCVCVYTCLLF